MCSECVETHKKQRATRDHIISALSFKICTVCENNNNASHYCSDPVCTSEGYTEFLCLECVETHKRQRATRNHLINPISVPPVPPPIPPRIYPISDDIYDEIDEIYEEICFDAPVAPKISDIPTLPPPVPPPLVTPKRYPIYEVNNKPMILPKKDTPTRRPAVPPKTNGTVP